MMGLPVSDPEIFCLKPKEPVLILNIFSKPQKPVSYPEIFF